MDIGIPMDLWVAKNIRLAERVKSQHNHRKQSLSSSAFTL
jgi:hypothetical protein